MQLHLVGGFLGSGKTTAIVGAARLLVARGLRVGVVTNHQGKTLVDTAFFKSAQLPAVEVSGGCFCCHYDDLAQRLEHLSAASRPQVIFAEAVGACTDLAATVARPLSALNTAYAPTSFSVFADCRVLRRRLRGEELPFSDELMFIFDQQIEEAGLLVVNKVDLLEGRALDELRALVRQRWPGRPVLFHSALGALAPGGADLRAGCHPARMHSSSERSEGSRTGWREILRCAQNDNNGLLDSPESAETQAGSPASSGGEGEATNAWLACIEGGAGGLGTPLRLDYARYAAAEGRLAWLDVRVDIEAEDGEARPVVMRLLEGLRAGMEQRRAGLAHLKVVLEGQRGTLKVSLTALDGVEWQAQLGEWRAGGKVGVILNLHAESTPAVLEEAARTALAGCGGRVQVVSLEARCPGYPRPTHRMG